MPSLRFAAIAARLFLPLVTCLLVAGCHVIRLDDPANGPRAAAGVDSASRAGRSRIALADRPDPNRRPVADRTPDGGPREVRKASFEKDAENDPSVPPGKPPRDEGTDSPRAADQPRAMIKSNVRVTVDRDGAASARALSVDDAISECLLADPTLKAGWEAIRQANADWVQASLKPNPTASIYQSLLPIGPAFHPDRQGGPPQLDVGIGLPVDWCLFGKRAAAMVSALRAVKVTECEYADHVRVRVRDTAVAYFDAVEARGLLQLARENLDNLTRVETATSKAVDDGGRPRVELNRIRLAALAGRQALREAETQEVATRAALRALLGRPPQAPDVEVPAEAPAPQAVEPLEVGAAFEIAVHNRPDLRALRGRIAKARADMVTEYRNGFPQVTSRAGYTRQYQKSALEQPDANSWGVGVDVSLPVHNRNQGNRLKSFSAARQAGFELRAGEIELRSELEAVSQELRAAVKNATSIASEQVRLATEVRDSITLAYESGGRPLIDMLDAQRNYRETYSLSITARADYWRALHRYHAAVGRQALTHDEHPAEPLPPPPAP